MVTETFSCQPAAGRSLHTQGRYANEKQLCTLYSLAPRLSFNWKERCRFSRHSNPSFSGWAAQEPLRKELYGCSVLVSEIIELGVMYDKLLAIKVPLEDTCVLRSHELRWFRFKNQGPKYGNRISSIINWLNVSYRGRAGTGPFRGHLGSST